MDAIKRELEQTLDDDDDMADMYLGRRRDAEREADEAEGGGSIVTTAAAKVDISACENLLESYYMRADYLSSRLDVLKGEKERGGKGGGGASGFLNFNPQLFLPSSLKQNE